MKHSIKQAITNAEPNAIAEHFEQSLKHNTAVFMDN